MDHSKYMQLQTDLLKLADIQNSLNILKTFMDKEDDTSCKLSDVVNTIISYRMYLVKNLMTNEYFTLYNLADTIKFILNE